MSLLEFQAFASIPRLKRDCVISEKIDGTNSIVHIADDCTTITAGSRDRWITPEDDNYGFARSVDQNRDELLKLGAGYHYGEWWGAGIQRRYGLTEKRWSLFNSARWAETRPACCHIVPALYQGPFSSEAVEAVATKLRAEGSVAAPGFMDPEGVVVYMAAARKLFKYTLDGDGHKGSKAVSR